MRERGIWYWALELEIGDLDWALGLGLEIEIGNWD